MKLNMFGGRGRKPTETRDHAATGHITSHKVEGGVNLMPVFGRATTRPVKTTDAVLNAVTAEKVNVGLIWGGDPEVDGRLAREIFTIEGLLRRTAGLEPPPYQPFTTPFCIGRVLTAETNAEVVNQGTLWTGLERITNLAKMLADAMAAAESNVLDPTEAMEPDATGAMNTRTGDRAGATRDLIEKINSRNRAYWESVSTGTPASTRDSVAGTVRSAHATSNMAVKIEKLNKANADFARKQWGV